MPSSQLYTVSIFYTFAKFKFKKIKLKTKVKELDSEYTILSICNGSYYGGGYKIAPKSRLTDGLLDIYYAEKMSKIKINKLTNANVYLNGVNLLGRAEEVQLPQIKHKMAEHTFIFR